MRRSRSRRCRRVKRQPHFIGRRTPTGVRIGSTARREARISRGHRRPGQTRAGTNRSRARRRPIRCRLVPGGPSRTEPFYRSRNRCRQRAARRSGQNGARPATRLPRSPSRHRVPPRSRHRAAPRSVPQPHSSSGSEPRFRLGGALPPLHVFAAHRTTRSFSRALERRHADRRGFQRICFPSAPRRYSRREIARSSYRFG